MFSVTKPAAHWFLETSVLRKKLYRHCGFEKEKCNEIILLQTHVVFAQFLRLENLGLRLLLECH